MNDGRFLISGGNALVYFFLCDFLPRNWVIKTDMDAAIISPNITTELKKIARFFFFLLFSLNFFGVRFLFNHFFIGDADRNKSNVGSGPFHHCLRIHRQHSQFWVEKFPGSRSSPLDEKFLQVPFSNQNFEVRVKNLFINWISMKCSTEKKSPGSSKEGPQGPERKIYPCRRLRGDDVVLMAEVGYQQVIDVRA